MPSWFLMLLTVVETGTNCQPASYYTVQSTQSAASQYKLGALVAHMQRSHSRLISLLWKRGISSLGRSMNTCMIVDIAQCIASYCGAISGRDAVLLNI